MTLLISTQRAMLAVSSMGFCLTLAACSPSTSEQAEELRLPIEA